MDNFQNILAVLQHDKEAPRLLHKLQRLSQINPKKPVASDISIVRTVYEGIADLRSSKVDISAELKNLVLSSEQKALADAIDNSGVYLPNITSAAMWQANLAQGVIDAAQDIQPDLIVKTCSRDNQGFHLRTPDDWNIIRQAQAPVLLTARNAWAERPTIAAAIDIYDPEHKALNAKILNCAAALAQQLTGELHLTCIFPTLTKWLDEVTTVVSYVKLREDIEQEIFDELHQFARQEGVEDYTCHAAEGETVDAMNNLVGLLAADILVLGSKARTGLSGALIGNTAEKLLHSVPCDILTVRDFQ